MATESQQKSTIELPPSWNEITDLPEFKEMDGNKRADTFRKWSDQIREYAFQNQDSLTTDVIEGLDEAVDIAGKQTAKLASVGKITPSSPYQQIKVNSVYKDPTSFGIIGDKTYDYVKFLGTTKNGPVFVKTKETPNAEELPGWMGVALSQQRKVEEGKKKQIEDVGAMLDEKKNLDALRKSNEQDRGIGSELYASLKRGGAGMAGTIAGFAQMMANEVANKQYTILPTGAEIPYDKNEISQAIISWGKKVEAENPKGKSSGDIFQPSNPSWWAANVPEQAAQIGVPILAGIGASVVTRNPRYAALIGTAIGAPQEIGSVYNEAKDSWLEAGETPEKAQELASLEGVLFGMPAAAIDYIPLEKILSKSGLAKDVKQTLIKRLISRGIHVGKSAAVEGLGESAQGVAEDLGAYLLRGKTKTVSEYLQSRAAEFTLGSVGGAVGGVLAPNTEEQAQLEPAPVSETRETNRVVLPERNVEMNPYQEPRDLIDEYIEQNKQDLEPTLPQDEEIQAHITPIEEIQSAQEVGEKTTQEVLNESVESQSQPVLDKTELGNTEEYRIVQPELEEVQPIQEKVGNEEVSQINGEVPFQPVEIPTEVISEETQGKEIAPSGEATKSQAENIESTKPLDEAERSINSLVSDNYDIVDQEVAKAKKKFPNASEDDLRSLANDAMISASKNFDPEKNNDFRGYARNGIKRRLSRPISEKSRNESSLTESLNKPIEEEVTKEDLTPSEEKTPQEIAQGNEVKQKWDKAQDDFRNILSDEDKGKWDAMKVRGTGTQKVSKKSIVDMAQKFRDYLHENHPELLHENVEDIQRFGKKPKNWNPTDKTKRDEIQLKYESKTGGELLDKIVRNTDNKYYKSLARLIKPVLDNVEIAWRNDDTYRPHAGLFYYKKGRPTVELNLNNIGEGSFEETALHEMIHAGTVQALDMAKYSPHLLSDRALIFSKNIEQLLSKAKERILVDKDSIKDFESKSKKLEYFSDPSKRKIYGLTNEFEFASEALTNSDFQDLLKRIPDESPTPKIRNLYDRFVDYVKKLFGIENLKGTAFDTAFKNILGIIDEQKQMAIHGEIESRGSPNAELAAPPKSESSEKEPTKSEKIKSIFNQLKDVNKEIRDQVPELSRRKAISAWIEAGGDNEILMRLKAESKSDAKKQVYEDAQHLNKSEMDLVVKMGKVHQILENKLKQAGMEGNAPSLADMINKTWNREYTSDQVKQSGAYSKGIKEGWNQAKESINQVSRIAAKKVDWNEADRNEVRDKLTKAVKDSIPKDEQGRFLDMVTKAMQGSSMDMLKNTNKVVEKINIKAEEYYRKNLVSQIKKTFDRAIKSPSVDVAVKSIMKDILNRISLTGITFKNPSKESIDRLQKIRDYINEAESRGETPNVPRQLVEQLSLLTQRSIHDLPNGILENINNQLQIAERIGRVRYSGIRAREDAEFKDGLNEILADTGNKVEAPPIQGKIAEEKTASYKIQNIQRYIFSKIKNVGESIMPIDAIFDYLQGGKQLYRGALFRVLRYPIDAVHNAAIGRRMTSMETLQNIIQKNKLDELSEERIGVYAVLKQEGGERRALDSGVSQSTIDKIKSQGLTYGEMEFYKAARNMLDQVYPEIKKVMHDLYNIEVPDIKNYTPWMRSFDYYEPPSDMKNSKTGESISPEELSIYSNIIGNFFPSKSSKLSQGFTIKRMAGAKTPIRFDFFNILAKHLSDSYRLVEMQPELKKASRIVKSKEFAEKFGIDGQSIMNDWLHVVATDGRGAGIQRNYILDGLRRNISKGVVFFNIVSNVLNSGDIPFGIARVGGVPNYLRGAQMAHTQEGKHFINKFPEVSERTAISFTMNEVQEELETTAKGVYRKALNFGQRYGYAIGRMIDSENARAVFIGKYLANLEEMGLTPTLDGEINDEAAGDALVSVRRVVSSSQAKDLPLVMSVGRGIAGGNASIGRLIHQFTQFSLERFQTIKHDIPKGFANEQYAQSSAYIASAITALWFESLLRKYLGEISDYTASAIGASEADEGDDKDEESIFISMLKNMLSTVPYANNVSSMINYKKSGVPALDKSILTVYDLANVRSIKGWETAKRWGINMSGDIASIAGIPGAAQVANVARKALVDKEEARREKSIAKSESKGE